MQRLNGKISSLVDRWVNHTGNGKVVFALCVLPALLLLSACVAPIPVEGEAVATPQRSNTRISDIADYDLPPQEPVIRPELTAVVNTEGSRANVRSGPDLDSPIVAKANPNDTFNVVGQSADGEWWQICCIAGPGDADGEASENAWLASVVVEIDGNAEAAPVVEPLLPDELSSSWMVDWRCGSDRCEVRQCSANIVATMGEDAEPGEQWLQVEHDVTWEDECFSTDSWVFEVDRFTGKERSGEFIDNFLYNYWLGEQPGPATNVYTFEDGRKVAVWCSGPHEVEIEEEGGWTTVYQGDTCHDVSTGELVSLSYTKRWLFSGEYDGQQYERAYFGDYETLEQYLSDTNVNLYYLEE